jgi:hypothetical protein
VRIAIKRAATYSLNVPGCSRNSGVLNQAGLYDRLWQNPTALMAKCVVLVDPYRSLKRAFCMNIYCEFLKEKIRIKINGEEIAVQLRDDFYPRKMFKDGITNNKLEGFVVYRKKSLGIIDRLKYRFVKNRVLILISKDIQELVTIRQIYNYASLILDAKFVYIIRKIDTINSEKLEELEKVSNDYINGRYHDDTIIASLTEENRIHVPEVEGASK